MGHISVLGITKRFGKLAAVDRVDLEIAEGEFVTLLGPSGCGKTTMLRMLAGFLTPEEGRILVDGELYSSPERCLPPERRQMGMVFQSYAVWPHRTAFENVAFGLKIRKRPAAEIRERVGAILKLVGLEGLEDRYAAQLSGGQQQRVALARSLVVEPRILLLDEPLSNLDAKLRERMRLELKQLQRRTGITFVYVTHDQAEAMALSDRIAVFRQGRVHQYASPREVYERPADKVVADFMGLVNFLEGRVEGPGPSGMVRIRPDLVLPVELPGWARAGQQVWLAIRPEDISLLPPVTPGAKTDLTTFPA
ncbi:MAG TPA: ABC transporter ATP-binding protein, partial [Candidatus Acidoferrum sp.]|nr:ABC transporter ATP-binding protein [Candidatus Acidoferrum sp.]